MTLSDLVDLEFRGRHRVRRLLVSYVYWERKPRFRGLLVRDKSKGARYRVWRCKNLSLVYI